MDDLDIHAFPVAVPERWARVQDGMGLRDWFAGQAIAGIMADHSRDAYPHEYAATAYEVAQAMLVERQKYEGNNNA